MSTKNDDNNFGEAAGFAAGGAVLGGGAAATLGGIGVLAPAAGVAIGIGAAPLWRWCCYRVGSLWHQKSV